MFLDAESNIESFSYYGQDDEWSNHPGLFGWCWKGKKKCEADRYEESVDNYDKQYAIKSDADCDSIDETIGSIDKALTKNANSGAKSRVIKRNARALENRRIDFQDEWDKKECSQQKLDEQSAEFDTNIQQMFNQAQLRSSERKTEDDTLTKVAISVGALVIGVVTYMAIKK